MFASNATTNTNMATNANMVTITDAYTAANANAHAYATTFSSSTPPSALDGLFQAVKKLSSFVNDALQRLCDYCAELFKPTPSPAVTPVSASVTELASIPHLFSSSSALPPVTPMEPSRDMDSDTMTVASISIASTSSQSSSISTSAWASEGSRSPSPTQPRAGSWSGFTTQAPIVDPTTAAALASILLIDDLLFPPFLSGPFVQDAPRRRYSANMRLQQRIAIQRIREAAIERRLDSSPDNHEPVGYECACGFCPNGIAAYPRCVAVTIRRTMRHFGDRVTKSAISKTFRRASPCFVRAATSYAGRGRC